jgi:glycosyltransferase involved in cell wall biosynthesis
MIDPLVSVVIPLYNKEKEVSGSLRSVLSQSVTDIEIIVVDDGSVDNGREMVFAFNDPRIRLVVQKNSGVSAARNRGIAEACSDMVAFLDADDQWRPDFLETVLRLSERFPECGVFASGYIYRYSDGYTRSAIIRGLEDASCEGILRDYFRVAAQSDPPLCSSSVAVRKSAITAIGGFPEGITIGEDLLTWARLAVRYEIAYCRSPLAVISAPLRKEDREQRLPETPDHVAMGLVRLMAEVRPEQAAGLRQYLALWHRMRAAVYLKFNLTAESRREIGYSSEYAGLSLRLLILMLLGYLPGTLPARLQHAINTTLQKIRSVKRISG